MLLPDRLLVISILIYAACGGSSSGPNEPRTERGAWSEPDPDFWQASPVCPDGGKAEESDGPDDTRIKVCKKADVEHGPKAIWHKSGNKMAEGLMRDGEVQGRWREWRADGKLQNVLEFQDGELHGHATRESQDGGHIEENYKLGKLHGKRTLKNKEGTLLAVEIYEEGKLNGDQVEYHPNGKKRLTATYVRGKPNGTMIRYSTAGKELGRVEMKNGTGTWTDWYDNGKKQVETAARDGTFDGAHKSFYENGNPDIQGQYRAGKEIGKWLAWSPEGVLLSSTEYEDGVVRQVATYTGGTLSRVDSYHGNGRRKSSVGVNEGKEDGAAVAWREDGTRIEQGSHRAGKKDGLWVTFAEDGTVKKAENFKKGKRAGKAKPPKEAPELPIAVLEVGIGVCDHYLRRFLTCAGLPAEGRAALPDAWEQLAQRKHASSRRDIENTCRSAAGNWDSQLSTLGC